MGLGVGRGTLVKVVKNQKGVDFGSSYSRPQVLRWNPSQQRPEEGSGVRTPDGWWKGMSKSEQMLVYVPAPTVLHPRRLTEDVT